MNRSTPGLPVYHQLLEFTQTHVHRLSDATQPSHPLSFPSPPAPNPSQHDGSPLTRQTSSGLTLVCTPDLELCLSPQDIVFLTLLLPVSSWSLKVNIMQTH